MKLSALPGIRRLTPFLLCIAASARGEGDLDYTFQFGGRTYAPIPYVSGSSFSSCSGSDVAVQADGKIVVAGVCELEGSADSVFYSFTAGAVMRLNADGSLDATFGNSPWPASTTYPAIPGFQFLSTGTAIVGGHVSVAARPDGRIVLGGIFTDVARFGATSFGFVQLDANGAYDASFGNGGVSTAFLSVNDDDDDALSRIALDGQGNIVFAGTYYQHSAGSGGNSDFLVGVVAANGGSSRVQKYAFDLGGNFADSANDLVIDAQGRYVLAGAVTPALNDLECGIIRVNPADLSLDTTFGTQGKQTLSFNTGGYNDNCVSLALQSGGSIVLAANVAGSGVGIARLLANGQPDTAFGLRFLASMGAASSQQSVSRVLVQPWDGRIILAGSGASGYCYDCQLDFNLVRLNSNGSLDTSFIAESVSSGPGSVMVDFGLEKIPGRETIDTARAIAFSGHQIVATGDSVDTTNPAQAHYVFAATRLIDTDIFRSSFELVPPDHITCNRNSILPDAFAAQIAANLDGQGFCIPPLSYGISGFGTVNACATSMCSATTAGCPVTLHAQAGSATLFAGHQTLDVSGMQAQVDTFSAPIQFSVFGIPQSCNATFSATSFGVSGTLDVATDHQWGGFPYDVSTVTIDSFTTTAADCGIYSALLTALLPEYEASAASILSSEISDVLLPAGYQDTDVCSE